jgi:hypothetical protein
VLQKFFIHPGAGWDPGLPWIPAFAGTDRGGYRLSDLIHWVSATEAEGPTDAVTGSRTQHNLVLQPILPAAASAANLEQKISRWFHIIPGFRLGSTRRRKLRQQHLSTTTIVARTAGLSNGFATMTCHFDKFMMRRAAMIQSSMIGMVDGVWAVSDWLRARLVAPECHCGVPR